MDSDMLMILENIARNTDPDDYETGGMYTVGGPSGNYLIHSPFNTECEWALYGASAIAGTGLIALSPANPSLLPMTVAGPTLGLASAGMDNNAFEGLVLPISTTQLWMPSLFWQPLGRGAVLNVAITMSATNLAYVSIVFRRQSVKAIPRLPRIKPHTHTPLSARRGRTFSMGVQESNPGRQVGKVINVVPQENTHTAKQHMPPGINPMAALDQRIKRRGGGL